MCVASAKLEETLLGRNPKNYLFTSKGDITERVERTRQGVRDRDGEIKRWKYIQNKRQKDIEKEKRDRQTDGQIYFERQK